MINELKAFDLKFVNDEIKVIAGIDEAGRGPLAGPVVAAAVIFENETFIEGINDSKKLTSKKRDELYDEIMDKAISVSTSIIDQSEIDDINILQATLKAMKQCCEELRPIPDLLLVDGNKIFPTKKRFETVVKGDSKSFSIAAASIIAKVTRDRIMLKLSDEHPQYKWHKNKGYGTKEHIEAIKKYGVTPYHRLSFLQKIINSDVSYQLSINA